MTQPLKKIRNLVLVLGDQLNRDASAWDGFDAALDVAWMAEASEESTHVWSSKQRTVLFLAAMRHFAQGLRDDGVPLLYQELTVSPRADVLSARSPTDPELTSLAGSLAETLRELSVERVVLTEPGDWRVLQSLRAAAGDRLDLRTDRHFMCSSAEFAAHTKGRKQLRMEYFYREMRRRHGVLMESSEPVGDDAVPPGRSASGPKSSPAALDQPVGGEWNYDTENRASFGAKGPGFVPATPRFAPDEITQGVIDLVLARFADHPGRVQSFGWPVTRAQALQVLDSFITERLEHFGRWQDAMWEGEPWLYHAHIASSLNLKLLDPREVIARAEQAWRDGRAPLPAVEGFIRQILGWREYVRGIYWMKMPGYAELNALGATEDLPAWFWTGDTPMRCLSDAITQTLEHGYAHHIQRLMVTGLYALLHGVAPKQVHGWYLSVYVDAVEWVELPNTLGMSQFADGGVMASKPYAATGKYIERQSNHCRGCKFDPAQRTGERACPFTTLYWDFLGRHEALLAKNPRMALQVKNLARIAPAERLAITERAAQVRRGSV